ncbi:MULTISPECIES: DUF4158 domain-containing protein [unclassified Streptomyces]|uniref:DUF4158 domain-containing protein n=1 Tax=unclassified Streptomyces TaxID=2593676 RepID=UPI0036667D97
MRPPRREGPGGGAVGAGAGDRLGWAAQWCCVRMLGVFPTEDLSAAPEAVVRVAAMRLADGRAPERGGRTRPRPGRTRRVCRGEPDTAVPVRSSGAWVLPPTTARRHRTPRPGGAGVSGPR